MVALDLATVLTKNGPFSKTQSFQVGRASAIGFLCPQKVWDGKTFCHFGFLKWSTVESENQQLLNTILEWASQQNVEMVVGPIDGTTIFNYRYRMNNFQLPPFSGEPDNTADDITRLENNKYRLLEKYESVFVDDIQQIKKLTQFWNSSTGELQFKKITSELWQKEINELPMLVDSIFSSNPGYIPLPAQVMKGIFSVEFVQTLCLQTSCFAYKGETLVGLAFNFQKDDTIYIKSLGLVPEVRKGGLGFISMIRFIVDQVEVDKKLVACLMRKGNLPDLLMKRVSKQRTEYGLFARNIK